MDRIHDAGDSGERLFRYLRTSRPTINAWFVIESGTADWRRLQAVSRMRVIPHGSLRWKLLMANCRHLISSHADVPVMRPPALMRFMEPRWRFTFLQHGVIKDDISSWLNPKQIDLFVTSTPQEYASIAGDHNAYAFTSKEVKLIGLPRFDRLRELGERFAPHQRDLVLIAPTWRVWLVPPLRTGSQRREVDQSFYQSDFIQNWMGLLNSAELAQVCGEERLTIGFLPHPNVQPTLPGLELPEHVRAFTFADNDVQELFARSAVLVTDYSSMAFNAAYIDRPLVYFQFDADRVRGGEHLGRSGYFDYERDGFGPVAYSLEEGIRLVTDTIRSGRNPSDEYQSRINSAFPLRDGRCCERVADAILESGQRVPADAAAMSVRD
jgi:CDP-glycerol glycerophosphotransferase (TagB/SpsB family)